MRVLFFIGVLATLLCVTLSKRSDRSNKDSYSEKSLVKHTREKRGVLPIFLISIQVLSKTLWIYRDTAGCTGYAPDLEANAKEADANQKALWDLKDSINFKWVPVYSLDQYIRRFGANIAILHQAFIQFSQLGTDITYAIDNSLSNKLKEAAKAAGNPDFTIDDFNKIIETASKYGESLSAHIEKLQMFPETEFDLPKLNRLILIGSYVSLSKQTLTFFKTVVDKLAPGAVGTMIRNALRISDDGPAVASLASTASDPMKKVPSWKIAKNFIVEGAGYVIGGFQLILEIVDQLKFKHNCVEMDTKAKEILAKQAESKKNMTAVYNEIHSSQLTLEKYYTELKKNLTEVMVISFLKQMKAVLENQEEFSSEIQIFDNYMAKIDAAGYGETDDLDEGLVKAVVSVNLKLNCLLEKLRSLRSVINDCEVGQGNTKDHYNTLLSKLSQLPKGCKASLTFADFSTTLSAAMSLRNLQPICARNDQTKQRLICEKYQGGDSKDNILNTMAGLTMSDVEYYISNCGNAQLSKQDIVMICELKKDGASLNKVMGQFKNYDDNAVTQAFNLDCKLDNSQINEICALKASLVTLADVEKQFSHYDPANVKKIYGGCSKRTTMTPNDEKLICQLKDQGFTMEKYPSLYNTFFEKYDKTAVNDQYAKCKAK